jgi:alpha-beta hydrolase superfamily lysophospholipase
LLLMHGTQDGIAFPSGSQEFAASAGEKATLVLWDDLYHETHNELKKEEVLRTSLAWMDRQLQA